MLSAGIAPGNAGSFIGNVVSGAVTNAVVQGIAVATGLQDKFDWAGVAAAGIAHGVNTSVSAKGLFGIKPTAGSFGSRALSGAASAIASAATRSAISGDSFGDSLRMQLPSLIGQLAGTALGEQFDGRSGIQTSVGPARKSGGLLGAIEDALSLPGKVGATVGRQVADVVSSIGRGGSDFSDVASLPGGSLAPDAHWDNEGGTVKSDMERFAARHPGGGNFALLQYSGGDFPERFAGATQRHAQGPAQAEEIVVTATREQVAEAKLMYSLIVQLGNIITQGEGNYESYNTGTGTSRGKVGFSFSNNPVGTVTGKTINEILSTESLSKYDKNRMFATGKYQTSIETLTLAKNALGLTGNELYTSEIQERVFSEFLLEKAGAGRLADFVLRGRGTVEAAQFAAAKEWASIGVPTGYPNQDGVVSNGYISYYQSPGQNAASASATNALQKFLVSLQISRTGGSN